MQQLHQVRPIEPPPPSPTTVVITATHDSDFDNPPQGTIIVAPGYTPED